MSIHLTTPINLTDLKGVTITINDVWIGDFQANANGQVTAGIYDLVTNTRLDNISFRAVANVNVIRGQIETYAVSAHLIEGTKV
ncbi:hypothetical protein CCP1ISM_1290003 [Azospirillaceae bacterium]